MGRNLGAVPLGVELGPHLTQCCPGRGLPLYQVASWSIQAFGHNKHGPKIGGGRGAGSPSNTMLLGSKPTFLPSCILINWAIWPQQMWAENWWGCAPLGEGDLRPHLTQCGPGQGLPACQVSSWSVQLFGHNTVHQRYRQDREDRTDRQNGPKAYGELFYKWPPKNWQPKK